MPVPLIGAPATTPLTLDTPVMVTLPLVVKPVGATVERPLAAADMVTLVPDAAVI
jgi:hypothetical protein